MKLLTNVFVALLILCAVAESTPLSPEAVWQGKPQSTPGSPWSCQVVSSNPSGTRLTLECPGFWIQPVMQQGQMRTQALMVDPLGASEKAGLTAQPGYPDLPAIGRMLAIPDNKAVEIIIHQVEWQAFPCDFPYLSEDDGGGMSLPVALSGQYPASWANVSTPGIMKDYRVAPVALYPLRYDPATRQLLLATRLEVEVRTTGLSTQNVKSFHCQQSKAFEPLYQGVIDNLYQYNYATPLVSEGHRGKYMIVTPDDYLTNSTFIEFVNWKKTLGYTVVIDTIVQTKSALQIKADIQAQYYAGDEPLDYVLLIGDQNINLNPPGIPNWTITKPDLSETDATDHQYSLLEGDDYFPDVMVGRIPVRDPSSLHIVLKKNLNYQMTPTTGPPNPNWFSSALLSAGCYADVQPHPITPAWSTLWLMDKLSDYGYTQVDTVIYWGVYGWGQTPQEGTILIKNSINIGKGLVAYRGWGAYDGWQFPVFKTPDINELANGPMLPVMVSIVCQTGNFADPRDPCFGEQWLRFGTSLGQKGGVAFYGPSELHTKTNWNNAIYGGFFEGLLTENLYRLGQAVLRSKLEVFNGFPNYRDPIGENAYVNFYFHIYNILGDPELPIWTDEPVPVTLQFPSQIPPGRQTVTVTARRQDGSPVIGAYIALYKGSDNLSVGGVTNGNGIVNLEVEPLTEGSLYVTASKQNCYPQRDSISVQLNSFPLGMTGLTVSGDGMAQAGETVQMSVALKNFGPTSLDNVQAALSENDLYATLNPPATLNLGTIAGLQQVPAIYTIQLAANTPNAHNVEFTLDLSNTSYSSQVKFILPVGGLQMLPVALYVDSGSVLPGHTAKLRPIVLNFGLVPGQGMTGTLTCQDNIVTVQAGVVSFPTTQPGDTAMANGAFRVQVAASAYSGRQVIFNLNLTAAGGISQTINYPMQLGAGASNDPLGPDTYGYFAYDNTDTGYTECPDFQWLELDPRYGGSGATYYPMNDEDNVTIPLPFTFTYYGLSFDTLSICSNGFVNFGRTWMSDFRNWNLPSSLGPPSLIAAFWDDLRADTSYGDTAIHVLTRYDQTEGRFIVEWSRTQNRYSWENPLQRKEETFQIVLFKPAQYPTATGDGEILMQYLVVHDVDQKENYATVGIEDEAHSRGLQYTFSNNLSPAAAPLVANRAIKFTTDTPVRTTANSISGIVPASLSFAGPSPNPANPGTVLSFTLPHAGRARVNLYDLMGRRVANLLEADLSAGPHRLAMNGEALANGIYFAVLRFESLSLTHKILILK